MLLKNSETGLLYICATFGHPCFPVDWLVQHREDLQSSRESSRGAYAHWTGCGDTSIRVSVEEELDVDLSKP